jgi:predicted  nucleic acid-binding Zn-ribbon protein
MGLKVEKVHACKNGCILFHGDNEALTECPKCGTSLYKWRSNAGDDNKEMRHRVPMKDAWYFPIIPHLKHLFATSEDARLLS